MQKTVKKAAFAIAASGALVLGGAGMASATAGHHGGASANGAAVGSPGVLSGNLIQVPIDVPINVCGNTISVIGLLNPTFGNTCVNH